ncbi:MAG: hypothetical protein M0038_04390 [Pseudomonadota bacterium]|jgi:hypothetical protein|nr:hypothetical protein [Pseudomonadota bacterium]
MTPAENLAPLAEAGAPSSVGSAAEAGPFVINLCSSSTPMALPRADLPELSRFTFFVSRRFEEGRERFRLHMGFFANQAEAESWLGLVREIYPGAWAGEAPGKKLRARAVAAAEAQAAHAAGPHSVAPQVEPPVELSTESATAPVLSLVEAPEEAKAVPTLHPPAEAEAVPAPAPARRAVSVPPPRASASEPAETARAPAVFGTSNIKEVLASLDEPLEATGATRTLPIPAAALSDAQALQCLEGRAPEALAKPAAFAVQLKWSVQPIAFEKLPPLAIFSAYTLYCVEGSREGRKWFGLRLGFFNDPISAKQVAGYVRSEFPSAAVVPVSGDERQRVSGESGALPPRTAAQAPQAVDHEFKLFDEEAPVRAAAPAAAPRESAAATPPKAPVHELRPAALAKRAAGGGKVHARERRAPQTLEETLEILGAHELTIEDRRDEAGDARGSGGARKLERSTPFTRLLERLGERVRKN